MRLGGNKNFLFLAIFAITLGEFFLDMATPLGVADWIWYFVPMILSLSAGNRFFPFLLAGLFSLLMLFGFYLSPPGIDPTIALIGRFAGISALWLMALVIARRKEVETVLRRTERALKTISTCNQVLVRATDEPALLREICDAIVETGGYRMAWVGFAENDENKSVRFAASAGCDEGYLAKSKISWSDADERGRGPAGNAIRTGQISVCNDIKNEPLVAPWSGEAAKRGYAAVIVLPLRNAEKTFGVLALYAAEANAFNATEIELLTELANDLAFGIHALRVRAEHARAEVALMESEQRYRHLFTHINEGVACCRMIFEEGRATDFVYLEVNPMFTTLTGFKDVIGKRVSEVIPGLRENDPQVMEIYGRVAATGQPEKFERFVSAMKMWFAVSVFSPEPGVFVAVFDVITARKEAEVQLQKLSRAVEQSSTSIVITNIKGEIEYVNPRFTDVTGYTLAEARGQNPRILKSGEMPPEFYRHLWQTIAAGHEWRGEFHNRKKNGELYWETASISPITDATGKITGYVAVKDDITRDKLAEEKIHEQAEMLNLAHDAITIRDLDGRITYWNHGAERIYGWSNAEAVGQVAGELLQVDQFKITEARRLLLQNGFWNGEITARAKNGHEVLVESTWTLVRDDAGRPKSIFTTSTDITDARKMEQQVARSQRIESLGTLASGVAHDLNNILTPIMVSIGLLKEQVTDTALLHLLGSLDASTQRGAQLVKQILTFGRGVQGERSPLSLREVAREIQRLIQETFPKSIQLEIVAPNDLWLVVGDHTQLHQVFLNLAINARDAMPNGGKLTFTFQNHNVDALYAGLNPEARLGANVLIQVTDTGTGISKDIIDRIFDPFFTTKAHGQGTGLGLSTTLGIIKSHGGFINVYSEPGKGTTFKIYLPANASAEQSEHQAVGQDGLPRGRNELILFVDDEEAIATTVKKILERHGYRVLTAANGAEAVSIYAAHADEIAAVITDMHMPIMDGPATIIALKSLNPLVKIIGSSGLAANGGVAKAASSGVRHFVPKPYTAEKMLRTVREVLDGNSDSAPSV